MIYKQEVEDTYDNDTMKNFVHFPTIPTDYAVPNMCMEIMTLKYQISNIKYNDKQKSLFVIGTFTQKSNIRGLHKLVLPCLV